jgi:HlyD family secretion protein
MRSEVGKDLADIRAKTAELVEKKVAAEDLLKRVDIRAPLDGVVHQFAVHTVGGVVGAGEVLMLIVPEADALEIEARIAPHNIDQVRVGQPAVLRFSASLHLPVRRNCFPCYAKKIPCFCAQGILLQVTEFPR